MGIEGLSTWPNGAGEGFIFFPLVLYLVLARGGKSNVSGGGVVRDQFAALAV